MVRIGTSGWSYDHWEHVLYPPGTPPFQRLAHYVNRFSTVELNSSFYRWPKASAFDSWRRRLPEGFQLTVKAPRALTQAKRLYAPEDWVRRIVGDLRRLKNRMGVLLVQLSPQFACDSARLQYFLDQIPDDLRVAVEFRDPSWHTEEIFRLLEQREVAYCVMSGAHRPCVLRATAPFVYVRLHGPDHHHLYAGSYSDDDLRWWADRIREWEAGGREVFAYFNNDGFGNAVRNAERLRQFV